MPQIRLLSAFAVLGALAGCVPPPVRPVSVVPAPSAVPAGVVVSYPPMPPPRFEPVPPPPRRREVLVWQPGHWQWDGYRYDWVPGHYVERVTGRARWVPGHWEPRPGGYAWVRGHWA